VHLLKGDKFDLVAAIGVPEERRQALAILDRNLNSHSVIGRAILGRRTVHIEKSVDKNAPALAPTTMLSVPLVHNKTVSGTITLARNFAEPFTQRQIRLVETFADQAVIAIENARLFEAEQARTSELIESLEYQTATSDVLSVISQSPESTDPVFDSIITMAERLCHADYGFVYRLGEHGRYNLVAAPRAPEEYVTYRTVHPIEPGDDSIMGRALIDGQAIHVVDTKFDREQPETEAHRQGRIRSALGVPLISGGKPIGVIGLVRSIPSAFTERQVRLVTIFADRP
jgi:GAF domain-containing protein